MKYEFKRVYRGKSQDISEYEMSRYYNEGRWELVTMAGPTFEGMVYWFKREKIAITEDEKYDETREYSQYE